MDDNRLLRWLSLLMGLCLVAVVAGLNMQHVLDGRLPAGATWATLTQFVLTAPECVAVLILAFGSALAVPVMQGAWRSGRTGIAMLTLVGMLAGESYGFVLSAERQLAHRADRTRIARTENEHRATAVWVVEREQRALAEIETAVRDEIRAGGCGKVCRTLKADEAVARHRLADATAALGRLNAPKVENHIAALTGLPSAAVDLLPSLAFSTALLLLGFAFIGFAHPFGPTRRSRSAADDVETRPGPTPPTRAEQVRVFVEAFRMMHGREPTFSEVRDSLQLPRSTASKYRTRALG